jgi:hypothetical protein
MTEFRAYMATLDYQQKLIACAPMYHKLQGILQIRITGALDKNVSEAEIRRIGNSFFQNRYRHEALLLLADRRSEHDIYRVAYRRSAGLDMEDWNQFRRYCVEGLNQDLHGNGQLSYLLEPAKDRAYRAYDKILRTRDIVQ